MTVTLLDVLAAGRARQASVVAETAGSVVLALADQVARLPRRLSAAAIELLPEGGLRLDGGEATSEAASELALRRLLRCLLDLTRGTAPSLSRVSARPVRGNLPALVHELEVALVPVNRAAGRRALARLHRETLRALTGGIPESADQWAQSVAEAVRTAVLDAADPAGVAGPSPEGPRLPPIATDVGEGSAVVERREPIPTAPPSPVQLDPPEDPSALPRLDDVTDRVPMVLLEEEGEPRLQHTVALSLPVSAPSARRLVGDPDESATETRSPNELTAPLLERTPQALRRGGGSGAPAVLEDTSVLPSEEITVPLPSRARRQAAVAAGGGGIAAVGDLEPSLPALPDVDAGEPPGNGVPYEPIEVAVPDEGPFEAALAEEGASLGDASTEGGPDRSARPGDASVVGSAAGPAVRPLPTAGETPRAIGAGSGGCHDGSGAPSGVASTLSPWGTSGGEIEDWLAALDGRWDDSRAPAAAPTPAAGAAPHLALGCPALPHGEEDSGNGRPLPALLLARQLPQGEGSAEEESVSWVAPRVAALFPGVVTVELGTPVPASSDPLDVAEPSPRAPGSRPPWRVRPTAGVFAPVASDVDDLVARFATGGSGDSAVADGLAAFVDTNHSPVPGPVQPWPSALSVRRSGAEPKLSRGAQRRGGAIERAPTAAAGRSR